MNYEEELRSALDTFVVEGRELLEDMESSLLGLEQESDPTEAINAVFRAAHTIKGSSGLFGLHHMVRFTHVVESVLDRLRTNEISVSSDLVGALLPCRDFLGVLIEGLADGRMEQTPDEAVHAEALLARLHPFLADDGAAASAPARDAVPTTTARVGDATVNGGADDQPWASGRRRVHLSLSFGPDCLRSGMDPLAFVRYLSTFGDVVALTTLTDLLPDAAEMDPECCYLDFEVTMDSDASLSVLADVFDFVRDDSRIEVLGAESSPAKWAGMVESSGALADRITQILVATQAVDDRVLAEALSTRRAGHAADVDLIDRAPGSDLGASGRVDGLHPAAPGTVAQIGRQASAPQVESRPTAARSRPAGEAAGRESRSIRIDAPRLDRLIDVVGELVIAGASAGLKAAHHRDEALVLALGEVMRLVEEVRDSALQLRMVPIGTTFSRFQRVVRDISADLGKDVNLVISGGDTEVDKALVEQIGDPLTHLVRNSMDHGIESAEERLAAGKPARGTLRLNAFHDSGSIVIEVSDDGGGIDVERVRAKALERGVVEPGTVLSDAEVYALIFEPGFSTASSVSNLSGRGVGMDVVKRNVTALRGTIDVESHPGQGCTMRIRLPLTLAIIDGFLVGVGGATFVVPLDRVIECVELAPSAETRDFMGLRGEVLPFIRLRSLFTIEGERPRRENVVVVEYAGMKVGLVVDTLMGEFQTVIKPLGRIFGHVRGISGSTILGNGDVALIIDVPMLVRHYGDRQTNVQQAVGSRE
jgi:two-component system chemotaxis sensor kinase CheA